MDSKNCSRSSKGGIGLSVVGSINVDNNVIGILLWFEIEVLQVLK
jgi:hypothetical protein